MVDNYHKATIPKGLSHEFIIYRHRSLEKTVRLERILGTDIRSGPWTNSPDPFAEVDIQSR